MTIKDRLAQLQSELERPLPTPTVGMTVLWNDRSITGNGRAAVVTQVLSPGKINLTIFPPNSVPIHRQGVLHKADPIHQRRNNSVSVQCGSWEYLEGVKTPDSHYNAHRENLKGRIKVVEDQIETEEKVKNPPKQTARKVTKQASASES